MKSRRFAARLSHGHAIRRCRRRRQPQRSATARDERRYDVIQPPAYAL